MAQCAMRLVGSIASHRIPFYSVVSHPIPSPSHPTPSHPIPWYPIPSHGIPSHPIPSHPPQVPTQRRLSALALRVTCRDLLHGVHAAARPSTQSPVSHPSLHCSIPFASDPVRSGPIRSDPVRSGPIRSDPPVHCAHVRMLSGSDLRGIPCGLVDKVMPNRLRSMGLRMMVARLPAFVRAPVSSLIHTQVRP